MPPMSQLTIEQAMQTAVAHHRAGRLGDAEAIYRQVLGVQPDNPDALHLLAVIAAQEGRHDAAIDLIRKAITLDPGNHGYHCDLGNFLRKRGQLDQALASYHRALSLRPDHAQTHNSLGNAWRSSRQFDLAIASYNKAVSLRPDLVEAHINLAICQRAIGQMDKSIASCRKALSLRPDDAMTLNNLAVSLMETGQWADAVDCCQRAVTIDPGCLRAHDNLLLTLLFHPETDPHTFLAKSLQWNARHAAPLERLIPRASTSFAQAGDRDPERPLRIGYVSPDFCNHPVGRFMLPLLACHDRGVVHVTCYAQVSAPDETTAKLLPHADAWRNIVGLSDQQAAQLIGQDNIDILVDLAGHTADNRLLVFAHKPAPVLVTYLGYPATTGLSAIDYRLTDALADPPGMTESHGCERLMRLPQTAWCFQPPDDAPPVGELPAKSNRYITFGSFNNMAKINEPLLKLWAEILRAVPGSRLRLKSRGLASASAQKMVRGVMSQCGIEPVRLDCSGWVGDGEHLRHYGQIDIALDTYPYHGTTTTCESLWMGVPVITRAGQTHVSRVGVSLLTNAGLPELIAQTPEHYVQSAADLAADRPRLMALRATLRDRLQDSVLMDARRFARGVEAAYRAMWQTWCSTSVK